MEEVINKEQEKAIEMSVLKPELKELAELNLKEGRAKQVKKLLNELLNSDDEIEVADNEFLYIDKRGNKKISIPKITEHLLLCYDFKTIFGKKDEIVYIYNNGIYEPKGKELIKTEVEKLISSNSSSSVVNEVYEKIKRNTAISYDEFQEIPIDLICLNNGILNLRTKELIPFNEKYYFKTKIPIDYDSTKKSELIIKFIEECCYPEDIPIIQEFFGYCLFRRYFIKKGIILFGEKDTGKTIFLNILTNFVGAKNISGISLQKIASKDKFALSSLKDKYANIYDDLSAEDLKDAGGFKIATGGGYITAEYKFGDSFQFMTFAKNIFATNKIPNVKDINDDAYYERWIPLPFDNQVKKPEQDKFLFEKLTVPQEMSGLLNWALEGLERLFENGEFSYKKTSEEIKVLMQRQNNPLVAFVDEVLQQEDGNKITKEMMYRIYSKWCQDKKVPRLSKEQLGRSLAKYTNYMIAKGGSERVWENVKVIQEYDIFDTFI